jgi:hypothetical protein
VYENASYYEVAETLRDVMSTYEREMQITQAVLDQAEADSPLSGYDTTKFYTVQKDADGNAAIVGADLTSIDATIEQQATDANGNYLYDTNGDPIYVGVTASTVFENPQFDGYNGYLTQDGVPSNGAPFTAGIAFPAGPVMGQFCLRKDYMPNRLFRFSGSRWVAIEDNVRMTMNNLGASDVATGQPFAGKDVRQTQKTGFINNTKTDVIDGHTVKEKQSLSKALRPQADE